MLHLLLQIYEVVREDIVKNLGSKTFRSVHEKKIVI